MGGNYDEFDYIIGNPPWASVSGLHENYCKKKKISISDRQIAQSFLIRARDFVSENGIVSFIVTNIIFSPFYIIFIFCP